MAPYGVQVTKQVQWRGKQEQFSNVYHYDVSGIQLDQGWEDFANAVVAKDKAAHSGNVTYSTVRVYGPTNQGAAANVTRYVGDLSGAGTGGFSGASIYKEATIVVQAYLGRSPTTQRKRFARKYYHVDTLPSSAATSIALGNDPLGAADKTAIANAFTSARTVSVGGVTRRLCTKQGDLVEDSAPIEVLNYLHIRQFRQ